MLLPHVSLNFLFISPYHPSLPEGFPDYILYLHRPVVDMFLLVGQH